MWNVSRATIAFILSLICLAFPAQEVSANAETDVAFLVNAKQPPNGVVFEIVEADSRAWDSVVVQISDFVARLRQASPSMKFAVVSHGREEFALLSENQAKQPRLHAAIKQWVADDVPVHVCATHASWEGKSKADFTDYIDVVEAGPTQIRDYQRKGYALVRVRPAANK